MTREEAINEIKSWAIPSEKGREVLETLIPELRENEDENLKNKSGYYKAGKFWKASTLWNATKNKVPQRVSNRYILQECTWNIGTLQRFANEVKNVQEVSLDYPIILDMNGNILDGAHRVVKAYLEGKDIDIVYLGDDEWPEPDYDEEKAVKESEDERIRKFLIQHISEWIGCIKQDLKHSSKDIESEKELAMFKAGLAYLEKQKESLPISEIGKENANSFIDGIIEVRSFQRGMEEGRRLEKQKENPKSADSIPSDCTAGANCEDRWHKVEDSLPDNSREVLCKDEARNYFIGRYYAGEGWEISNYDDEDKPHHLNPPVSKWIDFPSEQQKEQKHNYCLYGGYPNVGRCRWCSAACSARLADVHTDEEKEYIRTIKSIISDFIRDKKPENLAYYQRIYDWLDGRHVPFSCGHENGKPADPVFSKQEYESYPIISEDTTSAKPVELDGKALLYTADKSYQIGFRDGVASVKPAECSKVTINGEPIPTETKSVDIPLAEWSEDDRKMIESIVETIQDYAMETGQIDEETGGTKEPLISYINFLRSLRPSWKPSEEQMDRLFSIVAALRKDYCDDMADFLASIYHNLKKLM